VRRGFRTPAAGPGFIGRPEGRPSLTRLPTGHGARLQKRALQRQAMTASAALNARGYNLFAARAHVSHAVEIGV
jgi:hypothetical protein